MLHPCDCGESHTSILATIYCAEQIEADDRTAHHPPPAKTGPDRYELGYD